jgi:hypothetical protein
MIEEEQNWYFSFGVSHIPYEKNYIKIFGTCDSSREKMVSLFGSKWAFQYESLEKLNPEKWGLTELEITQAGKKYLEYGDAIHFSDKLNKETLWEMYELQVEEYKLTKKELEENEGVVLRPPWWRFYPSEKTSLGIRPGLIEWRAFGDRA